MTIDQANTALAIASTKQQRIAAYKQLALAAAFAAAGHDNTNDNTNSQVRSLLTRTRELLDIAATRLADLPGGDQHALDEIEDAINTLTIAIEAL